MSGSEATPDHQTLVRPPANLQFLVWLVLLGVPALLVFLIAGKQYDIQVFDRPALDSPAIVDSVESHHG